MPALAPSALRCVLYHHVAARECALTAGLGVTLSPEAFERSIARLARRYDPVGLDEVLAAAAGGSPLPRRPLLVTFDDAYASVARLAARVLRRHRVPAVFFVNAAFLDCGRLNLDNLAAYAANVRGAEFLREAARAVRPEDLALPATLEDTLGRWVPELASPEVEAFRLALAEGVGAAAEAEAREQGLYLSTPELRQLAGQLEIGNHCLGHPRCRSLGGAELEREVVEGQRRLAEIGGRPVRAFSVPYGSAADLTPALRAVVRASGHTAVFLVEGRLNSRRPDPANLFRVSLHATSGPGLFWELEVAPRLRGLRRALRPA